MSSKKPSPKTQRSSPLKTKNAAPKQAPKAGKKVPKVVSKPAAKSPPKVAQKSAGKPAPKPAKKPAPKTAPKSTPKSKPTPPAPQAKKTAPQPQTRSPKPAAPERTVSQAKSASSKTSKPTSTVKNNTSSKSGLPPAPKSGSNAKGTTRTGEGETARARVNPVTAAASRRQEDRARRRGPVQRVSFSLDEALEVVRSNASKQTPEPRATEGELPAGVQATAATPQRRKVEVAVAPKNEARVLRAASLADILGFDPSAAADPEEEEASRVPDKWQRYYKLLVDLRRHIKEGLTLHSEETLMKSAKEDSGDLSGYSQHMADSGTDTFDRDFALSVVANEQEALNEIEAAIKRIHAGTYGTCEITAKPIAKERLLAVPFARYSVESQAEVEKIRRQRAARGNTLAEFEDEEGGTPVAGGSGEDESSDE